MFRLSLCRVQLKELVLSIQCESSSVINQNYYCSSAPVFSIHHYSCSSLYLFPFSLIQTSLRLILIDYHFEANQQKWIQNHNCFLAENFNDSVVIISISVAIQYTNLLVLVFLGIYVYSYLRQSPHINICVPPNHQRRV